MFFCIFLRHGWARDLRYTVVVDRGRAFLLAGCGINVTEEAKREALSFNWSLTLVPVCLPPKIKTTTHASCKAEEQEQLLILEEAVRQTHGIGRSSGAGAGSGILGSSAETLQIIQALTAADAHRAESAAAVAVAAAAEAAAAGADVRDSEDEVEDDDEDDDEDDEEEEEEGADPRVSPASMSGEVRDIMARFKARAEAKAGGVATAGALAADAAEGGRQQDGSPAIPQQGGEREREKGDGRGTAAEIEDEHNDYLMVRGEGSGDGSGEDDGDGHDNHGESKEEGEQAEEKGSEPGDAKPGSSGGDAPASASTVEASGEAGAKPPEIGPGEYLLKVVYAKGATMRDGVEIDEAAVVGNLPSGSIVVSTARVICSCGIPRFKTPEGWISEWLRGGMEELVVEVLHHRPREPIRYQIICNGGAMVRQTASISGPEAKGGGCSHGTIVSVAERLRLPDGTMRLRVVDPPHNVGWISEKENIVRRVVSFNKTVSRTFQTCTAAFAPVLSNALFFMFGDFGVARTHQ